MLKSGAELTMYRSAMKEELVPLTEAKARIHELVRGLDDHDVLLLRHGHPVGVMTSYTAHQELLERIEDLEDRLAVYEAREEAPDLRIPWEKVKAESGLA